MNKSNYSLEPFINPCFTSDVSLALFSTMFFVNLLLLPVFVLVLYLGYQRWRRQRGASSAAGGHSDLFTYHAIALQVNIFLGLFLIFYGSRNGLLSILAVGLFLLYITSGGQALLHVLTCVEHYLAVVHPVTYMRVKQAAEGRIRHGCAGCVWLLSVGWLMVNVLGNSDFSFVFCLSTVVTCILVICFCSISVLCALRRPGPGEGGGSRAQADQSKRRAFNTILIILAVLLFGFVGNVLVNILPGAFINTCALWFSSIWLNLPSNLVLPVLFLHRAGKLPHCKQKSGPDEAGGV